MRSWRQKDVWSTLVAALFTKLLLVCVKSVYARAALRESLSSSMNYDMQNEVTSSKSPKSSGEVPTASLLNQIIRKMFWKCCFQGFFLTPALLKWLSVKRPTATDRPTLISISQFLVPQWFSSSYNCSSITTQCENPYKCYSLIRALTTADLLRKTRALRSRKRKLFITPNSLPKKAI